MSAIVKLHKLPKQGGKREDSFIVEFETANSKQLILGSGKLGNLKNYKSADSLKYSVQILPDLTKYQRDCRSKLLLYKSVLMARGKKVVLKSHHWYGMLVDDVYKTLDAMKREYNFE